MNEILKLLAETGDKKLLNLLLKCITDEMHDELSNEFMKLNNEQLLWLVSYLGVNGYSDEKIEEIIKGL